MKFYSFFSLLIFVVLLSCNPEKTSQKNSEVSASDSLKPVKISLEDSIEAQVNALEGNMSIKIRRRNQILPNGNSIQFHKFYAYGDTNQTVKVREHKVINKDVYVVQYYFHNNTLYYIHDYSYKQNCDLFKTACKSEGKFYFSQGKFYSATKRESVSPDGKSEPSLTGIPFSTFVPADSLVKVKENYLASINTIFNTLTDEKAK